MINAMMTELISKHICGQKIMSVEPVGAAQFLLRLENELKFTVTIAIEEDPEVPQ